VCDSRLFVVWPKSSFVHEYFVSDADPRPSVISQSNPDTDGGNERIRFSSSSDADADSKRLRAGHSSRVPESRAKSGAGDH